MKYLFFILTMLLTVNANEIAIAKNITGSVSAKYLSKSISIVDGNPLNNEMVLFTKDNSSVTIIFKDNSKLVLGSNAILNLKKYVFEPQKDEYDIELFLEAGSLSFESGKIGQLSPEDFILKTPDGTVSIRGTKFFVKVQ